MHILQYNDRVLSVDNMLTTYFYQLMSQFRPEKPNEL